jgi:hypothetical protein
LAKNEHLHLPLLEASKRQFDRIVELGLGEIDKSGIPGIPELQRFFLYPWKLGDFMFNGDILHNFE